MTDFHAACHLLNLPREMRNLIYEWFILACHKAAATRSALRVCKRPLLHNLVEDNAQWPFPSSSSSSSQIAPLLLTNRQIRDEFTNEIFHHVHEEYTISIPKSLLHPTTTIFPPGSNNNNNNNVVVPTATAVTLHAPLWTLPHPTALFSQLRSLGFTAWAPAAVQSEHVRDWRLVHDAFDASVRRLLVDLPNLEHLSVALSFAAGTFLTYEGPVAVDMAMFIHPRRVTGFKFPGLKIKKKRRRESSQSGDVGGTVGGVEDGRSIESGADVDDVEAGRSIDGGKGDTAEPAKASEKVNVSLKWFRKAMVIRFICQPDYPWPITLQEDSYDEAAGNLRSFGDTRHVGFASEWSTASLAEIRSFLHLVLKNGSFADYYLQQAMEGKLDLPSHIYELWKENSRMTRDRMHELLAEKEKAEKEAAEAALKATETATQSAAV